MRFKTRVKRAVKDWRRRLHVAAIALAGEPLSTGEGVGKLLSAERRKISKQRPATKP